MEHLTLWDWLASPIGVDLAHAVIVLVLSLAAWFSYLAHDQSKANAAKLDSHIEQHVLDAATGDDQPAAINPPSPR